MLSIPMFAEIEGLPIFRDDVDLGKFYYLPGQPRLARGPDGKPMFTYLFFQLPIEREAEQRVGGYLVFTTEMRVDKEKLQRVESALAAKVSAEVHDPPLSVSLAAVDFVTGEARLLIMQNDKYVGAVQLGKPSLFGDNTVSVAVELPELGAGLFREALRQGGSIGAIEYDLTFEVRLPAVQILGHVDSKEVKEAVIGYTVEKIREEDTWGNVDETEVAHRTSVAESMQSQGLIKLEILKGSTSLSDEDMESLHAFAFRAMDEFIKEHFLKGGELVSDADRESQWMSFIHQDIQATFNLNVSYRDVITRQYNPSAQINPSFLGAPIEDVILDIDLAKAPWYYNTLEVTLATNFDFDKYGDLVHSVVGHLSYEATDDEGNKITKRESYLFTKDDNKPKEKAFKTRVVAVGKDTYHVDVEVNYKAGPVTQRKLASFETTKRDLVLEVPNPGVMEITFVTEPAAFDGQLTAVEAEIEYGDPRHSVSRITESVLLDKDHTEATYKRPIFAPWEQKYRCRYTYNIAGGEEGEGPQRITGDWEEKEPPELGLAARIKVPTPFDTQFDLTVVPQVDWKEVRELIVDLEYEDTANDYRQKKTFSFSEAGGTTSAKWKFPLRDQNARNYRYSQKLFMVNGAVVEGEWVEVESDKDTLAVGNAPGGVATVQIDPSDTMIGTEVKRVVVRLKYEDAENGVLDTETLLFKDTTMQQWTVARADAAKDAYSYDVEYHRADGTTRTLAGQHGRLGATTEFLFIPAPPAA